MKFMGSKRRIAKDIIKIMYDYTKNKDIKVFYDVFCGGRKFNI